MKKTLKELAEITGFSPATISRALTRNKSINNETRVRVEKALGKINYTPARVSRKKYARKTVLIISGETSSNFYARAFSSIREVLRAKGYFLLVADTDFTNEHAEQYVEYAQAQEFCGILMLTMVETPALVRLLAKLTCPIVLVDRYLRSIDVSAVHMDNFRAGYMVGKYLYDMGHRRIACFAGETPSVAISDRITGFTEAMADLNVADYSVWRKGNLLSLEAGKTFGREFLASMRDHSVVFCLNELTTRGFVDIVQGNGLRIPDDVSLMCFTPAPLTLEGGMELTSVIHDVELMGRTAAELLLEHMNDPTQAPRKITFPPRLNIRNSVLPCPGQV